MTHLDIKNKKGFTIIEVVLVLAIAGLIFMMVFVAVPSLQRTRSDTARKNDLSRLSSSIISYVSSNNKLPAENESQFYVNSGNVSSATSGWKKFAKDYLLSIDGANQSLDDFTDPSGDPYAMVVVKNTDNVTDKLKSFSNDSGNKTSGALIVVGTGTSCAPEATDGFKKQSNDGARNFAVAIRLEAGGVYCIDN